MTLDPDTRAKIEAEEAYRAELRRAQRNRGCGKWAIALIGIPVLLLTALIGCGRFFSATENPQERAARDREVDFVVNCERQIKTQLKSPSTAKISNAWEDKVLSTYSGYSWRGFVDAQNSFGANIRTEFICSGSPESPTVAFGN